MGIETVVIGAGPAGVEAACAAASAGAAVTVVSDGAVGGRAGWHSLLPSKVWLNAANHLHQFSQAPSQGTTNPGKLALDPFSILERVTAVAESWNRDQEQRLLSLGVNVIQGAASFVSDSELVVRNGNKEIVSQLRGDNFIIATGSLPKFPPTLKPDGKRILAPRFARQLSEVPPDVVVIGAGATGTEFASLFRLAGAQITWVVDQYGVLPTFDEDSRTRFRRQIENQGVQIVGPTMAERVTSDNQFVTIHTSSGECYQATMVFLAIGRTPDLARLDLEAAGLDRGEGLPPATDPYGRTEKPWIYLVGDATGSPMVANKAMAQAWVAGRHAAGAKTSPYLPETIVKAVYSHPEVAEVGTLTDAEIVSVSYDRLLKTRLCSYEGFVKLAFDKDQRIKGGAAVGPHASEILAPVAVAIRAGLLLDDFASVFAAHPTVSELPFLAARQSLNRRRR